MKEYDNLLYGILSIKEEEAMSKYSLGCSDSVVRMIEINEDSVKEIGVYGKSDPKNCCLMHDSNKVFEYFKHLDQSSFRVTEWKYTNI